MGKNVSFCAVCSKCGGVREVSDMPNISKGVGEEKSLFCVECKGVTSHIVIGNSAVWFKENFGGAKKIAGSKERVANIRSALEILERKIDEYRSGYGVPTEVHRRR